MSKDMKIAICFGLIMGALISICNMCFAAETITYNIANNLGISSQGSFVSSSTNVGYFEIEPGYRYTILNNSNYQKSLALSNDVPSLGGSLSFLGVLDGQSSYVFNSSDFGFIYFDLAAAASNVVVTREKLLGMTGFVDNLAYDLSYSNLSGVLFFVVPLMAISVLFGLGFVLLGKIIKKMRNAKGGM